MKPNENPREPRENRTKNKKIQAKPHEAPEPRENHTKTQKIPSKTP